MWDIPDETHSNVPHDLPVVIGNVPVCPLGVCGQAHQMGEWHKD